MSALGHKQALRNVRAMSAFPTGNGRRSLMECPLSANSGHHCSDRSNHDSYWNPAIMGAVSFMTSASSS